MLTPKVQVLFQVSVRVKELELVVRPLFLESRKYTTQIDGYRSSVSRPYLVEKREGLFRACHKVLYPLVDYETTQRLVGACT
jgi:hypothetical protein